MSKYLRCGCGEVHFCNIKNYKTSDGATLDVIICDACGRAYNEPKNAIDMNNGKWKKKDG